MRSDGTPARGPRAPISVVAVLVLGALTSAFTSRTTQDSTRTNGQSPTPQLGAVLASLAGGDLPPLPAADAFKPGARSIVEGSHVPGPIAVSEGAVDVYGTVDGDVVSFRGDIVVHERGTITGNAIAIAGVVHLRGGHVGGQTLSLSGELQGVPNADEPPAKRIVDRLTLVGGWFVVLLALAIGVLVLASDNLAAVADALERHYGSTLVAGVAGQVAFAPLLVALVVALVLSVLGILLVPFAAVAYVIVAAGLVTLGYLATAVMIGRGWRSAPPGSDRAQRAATLRALFVGIVVLLSPWAVAALLAAWPLAESLARGVAFAVTWVAATAGLGATLISRAGIKRAQSRQAQSALASPSWQTPTPVSGVVAARRPAVTPSQGAR
jgi:hypothetical protein